MKEKKLSSLESFSICSIPGLEKKYISLRVKLIRESCSKHPEPQPFLQGTVGKGRRDKGPQGKSALLPKPDPALTYVLGVKELPVRIFDAEEDRVTQIQPQQ